MKRLIIVVLLSGCASYGVGVSVHNGPDENFENPLGIVRGATQYNEYIEGFCEHISSIPMVDDTFWINHCGALLIF